MLKHPTVKIPIDGRSQEVRLLATRPRRRVLARTNQVLVIAVIAAAVAQHERARERFLIATREVTVLAARVGADALLRLPHVFGHLAAVRECVCEVAVGKLIR